MHDIDRTHREFLAEFEGENEELEGETFETMELAQGELGEVTSPFNEVQELELASELLEISSEGELEQFLGKLLRGATRAVGGFVRSPIGKALGGALKGLAKTALPLAGRALGTMVGGPLGGMVGGKLGNMAGNLFELELEGLSQEDREFEVAKHFVRLAGSAAQAAVRSPGAGDPRAIAQRALAAAARTYAPGLARQGFAGGRQTGRWVRRGRNIVLLGA